MLYVSTFWELRVILSTSPQALRGAANPGRAGVREPYNSLTETMLFNHTQQLRNSILYTTWHLPAAPYRGLLPTLLPSRQTVPALITRLCFGLA